MSIDRKVKIIFVQLKYLVDTTSYTETHKLKKKISSFCD